MNVLIKACQIIDPQSAFNQQTKDILIENSIITKIEDDIANPKNFEQIEGESLKVSPGWLDMTVDFCDPGFEHKEDIESGLSAAAKGGFTAVGVLPNTSPVIDTKAQVQYIINKAKPFLTEVLVIGAATNNLDSVHLAEMYDMELAGAVAFSNGKKPITNAGAMLRCLQYVIPNEGLIINFPDELTISVGGHLNEGVTSTLMGTKGKPHLAEYSMIQRDINLLEYTNSRLHFSQVSTAQSVNLIKQAKENDLNLSCSVSPLHLIFTDEKAENFNSNWKTDPPLRTQKDITALIDGLKSGVIDCISSFHSPQDIDSKNLEFDQAEFGVVGLQTVFLLLNHYLSDEINDELLIKLLAINPRKILKQQLPEIAVGKQANITIFSRKGSTVIDENFIESKSKNTPLLGETLKGKIITTINNGKIIKSPA